MQNGLSRQYSWACNVLNVITEKTRNFSETEIRKRENVNIARGREANKLEQDRIFTLLSRTEVIESVTFVRNTVSWWICKNVSREKVKSSWNTRESVYWNDWRTNWHVCDAKVVKQYFAKKKI